MRARVERRHGARARGRRAGRRETLHRLRLGRRRVQLLDRRGALERVAVVAFDLHERRTGRERSEAPQRTAPRDREDPQFRQPRQRLDGLDRRARDHEVLEGGQARERRQIAHGGVGRVEHLEPGQPGERRQVAHVLEAVEMEPLELHEPGQRLHVGEGPRLGRPHHELAERRPVLDAREARERRAHHVELFEARQVAQGRPRPDGRPEEVEDAELRQEAQRTRIGHGAHRDVELFELGQVLERAQPRERLAAVQLQVRERAKRADDVRRVDPEPVELQIAKADERADRLEIGRRVLPGNAQRLQRRKVEERREIAAAAQRYVFEPDQRAKGREIEALVRVDAEAAEARQARERREVAQRGPVDLELFEAREGGQRREIGQQRRGADLELLQRRQPAEGAEVSQHLVLIEEDLRRRGALVVGERVDPRPQALVVRRRAALRDTRQRHRARQPRAKAQAARRREPRAVDGSPEAAQHLDGALAAEARPIPLGHPQLGLGDRLFDGRSHEVRLEEPRGRFAEHPVPAREGRLDDHVGERDRAGVAAEQERPLEVHPREAIEEEPRGAKEPLLRDGFFREWHDRSRRAR